MSENFREVGIKLYIEEHQKIILEAAAKTHFAMVHDLVDNWNKDLGVKCSGSVTGIRLIHIWDTFPQWVRDKFPDVEHTANVVKSGQYHYSGPKRLGRCENGDLGYQSHNVDSVMEMKKD